MSLFVHRVLVWIRVEMRKKYANGDLESQNVLRPSYSYTLGVQQLSWLRRVVFPIKACQVEMHTIST